MKSLEEIKEKLLRPEINLKGKASIIGISYHQLRSVLYGKNPRYENIKKISDYLESEEREY